MSPRSLPPGRLVPLDAQRGLAVFSMIIVNALEPFGVVPAWAKHASPGGFTFVDLIAPMFVFVMGLSYDLSFSRRREKAGLAAALRHLLFRYGILFFFGSCGTLLIWGLSRRVEWNILQTLGAVGLAALPIVFVRAPWARLLTGALWMGLFQVALMLGLHGWMASSEIVHELFRAVGLASILVFGAALSTRARSGTALGWLYGGGALLTALGVALSFVIQIERTFCSLPFLLLGLGLSLLVTAIAFHLHAARGWSAPLLPVLGRNALVLFMVSAVATLVLHAVVQPGDSALPVYLGTGAVLGLCVALGLVLDWRGIYVKL